MKNVAYVFFAACLLFVGQIDAQSETGFTYQGQLLDAGSPANGTFSMEFSLWDEEEDGEQLGAEIPINVGVNDGRFSVGLSFGADTFDGSERWINVKVDGINLSPRQLITRTPYALQTRGLFVNDDETFVGVGRTSPMDANEQFGIFSPTINDFAGMYVQTAGASALPYYGYSAGGDIDAVHFYNGNTGRWHLRMGGDVMVVESAATGGHVGLGPFNPNYKLDVSVVDSESRGINVRVFDSGSGTFGDGIVTETDDPTGFGVWAINDAGLTAGRFEGNVGISGNISKAAGSFKIDHPLDPENKYLYHSFVESPDMMNIYNGNVVTDANGYATVEMPEWFDALNRDFRYQLTVVDDTNTDEFVLAKVVQKMQDNHFRFRSSEPNTEVSWQVTGVRQDAYANANRIPVEEFKPGFERGFYANPEVFGKSKELGTLAARLKMQAKNKAEYERQR